MPDKADAERSARIAQSPGAALAMNSAWPFEDIDEHEWVIDPAIVHQHVGHALTVSVYGGRNLAIECLDCMVIIGDIDFAKGEA